MNSNGTTFGFSPFWLACLTQQEQDEVRQWLTDAGVNINLCPGFDFDGKLITTRYYARNEMGSPMITESDEFIYEDQVREFPVKSTPKPVTRHCHG